MLFTIGSWAGSGPRPFDTRNSLMFSHISIVSRRAGQTDLHCPHMVHSYARWDNSLSSSSDTGFGPSSRALIPYCRLMNSRRRRILPRGVMSSSSCASPPVGQVSVHSPHLTHAS
jgi:hypothetical protein